jgi:2-keto-4-pentenoate hydratase/2-oxohepta-3-ene-1,7-dioic acid hydratase in catechol pathway
MGNAAGAEKGVAMRIVRFRLNGEPRYGVLDDRDEIQALRGDPFGSLDAEGERFRLSEVELLAPCEPSKVVGIGLNYRDHAAEVGLELPEDPMLFLMPETAVIGPGRTIRLPKMSEWVDYEGELAIVIGRPAFQIRPEEAEDCILGYTCFNDVTARDLQIKDVQFTRSKSFDTFAPMGPWIATDIDPRALDIETYVNGEQKQSSNTRQLLFDPFQLVHFVSWVMTLHPGDVIASGTPAGIGPLHAGDKVEIRIQEIGSLVNTVAS